MLNNKMMKLNYFFTLKAPWDGQGKMHYGMSRVKKHPSGKRSTLFTQVF